MLVVFVLVSMIYIQPVEAAGYTVEKGPRYVDITCELCKDGSSPKKHRVDLDTYNNEWADIENNSDIGKIKCKLCRKTTTNPNEDATVTHCALAIAENSTKRMAYNVVVGANSDFLTYTSILGDGDSQFSLDKILKFDSATYSTQLGAIKQVYPALVNIGEIIILIYFILELGEMSLQDRLSYESLIYTTIKSLLACLVIANAMDWIIAGLNTCSDIFDTLLTTYSGNSTAIYQEGQCVYDRIMEGSELSALGEIATAAPYCLFVAITYVTVYAICWARVFDIFVRIVFAPIGLADFMHGGTNCLAVRYFKKLLASVLQGACIMGVICAYNAINGAIRGGLEGAAVSIIVGFAVITACQQTGKIATEIVGA